jgi:D-lactate dehydrogenase
VFAASEQEVAALLAISHDLALPLTFRAAGTSLSGQAITDGILVDLSRAFGEIGVEEGGLRVRVRPGAIGGHVNLALQPYARKMGPDPASIHTCRMGGILSNNASGMCCGVEQNAYHTLRSLTFILPSGTCIDTADPGADDEPHASARARAPCGTARPETAPEGDVMLAARIRAKYRMKNTTGYSLNAFLDFARPVGHLCAMS